MRRTEFLETLKKALDGEISIEDIRNNLDYYDQYIRTEVSAGKSEEEVLDELGDPQLIAKTIIDTAKAGGSASPEGYSPSDGYGPTGDTTGESGGMDETHQGTGESGFQSGENPGADRKPRRETDSQVHMHQIDFSKWYVKLVAALLVVLILFLLFLVIGGAFVFIFRYGGVIIIFLLIYWLIRGFFD